MIRSSAKNCRGVVIRFRFVFSHSAYSQMKMLDNQSSLIVTSPDQYDEIKFIALFFLLIWPIGMPLIGMLVLLPIRKALRQNRNSPMVQATAFLHREYRPTVILAQTPTPNLAR